MHSNSTVMDASIGRAVAPNSEIRCPSWNIHVTMPTAAVSDSPFTTSARSGCSTLPVNRNSSTNVVSTMIPRASGSGRPMELSASASVASAPPTRIPGPESMWTARRPSITCRAPSVPPSTSVSTISRCQPPAVSGPAAGSAGPAEPAIAVISGAATAETCGTVDRASA